VKNWTNTRSSARRAAERLRRGVAATVAALAVGAAAPAHAYQATQLADGSFEYFFAAPSLRIASAGDLDLSGLSFIEGVADGFRVGASFMLEWLGGEDARLAPAAATWSGLAGEPRRLDIVAGGDLTFGTVSLALAGGTITLSAASELDLGDGSRIDVGGTGGGGGSGAVIIGMPGALLPRPPLSGGGTLTIAPGGDITLVGSPSPVPEPTAWAVLLAGLMILSGIVRRGPRMER
jgi:hypothetical protein